MAEQLQRPRPGHFVLGFLSLVAIVVTTLWPLPAAAGGASGAPGMVSGQTGSSNSANGSIYENQSLSAEAEFAAKTQQEFWNHTLIAPLLLNPTSGIAFAFVGLFAPHVAHAPGPDDFSQ